LPKTLIEEGAKEDWVFRMSIKTDKGDYLTLGFEVGEPRRDKDAVACFPKQEIVYALYRDRMKGTITLHDRRTACSVATFTFALDSIGFNREEKK
jgi:hypothetical protein